MRSSNLFATTSLFFLVLPGVGGPNTFAASNPETGPKYKEIRKDVLNSPWPHYPYIARLKLHDGFGTYKLTIDHETGQVVSVDVVKTTTHKELDDCAIKAFRQWRFRPHTEKEVLVPVTFTYGNRKLSEARRLAVYAPDPPQPVTWHHGTGTFRFIVDYETGKVTDVQIIKSSGRPSFDQGVVNAYRQWRFLPHKVHTIDTTVGFSS
jgi:TonB family protein